MLVPALLLVHTAAGGTAGGGPYCTHIDFTDATLDVANFGGPQYCCNICPNDSSKLCCPSRDDNGETTLEIDRNPAGNQGIFESNVCDYGVDTHDVDILGTKSYFKLDGVQTNQAIPSVAIVVMNITEYASTWPQLDSTDPWGLKPAGYLNNGLKSGKAASADLVQFNLCGGRMLKIKACFVTSRPPSNPVTLSKASVRFFDIDHGKDSGASQHLGPEVIQFACPGGTFQLFGRDVEENVDSVEFLVNMDSFSRSRKRPDDPTDISPSGLQIHTYDCPPAGKLVTLWSSRFGSGKDNPVSTACVDDPTGSSCNKELTQLQERSMVIMNYVNVDCFDVTLANLPADYEEGTEQAIADGGFAIQRLENSEEIIAGDKTWKVDTGECKSNQNGRNWLFAGLRGTLEQDCESPPPAPPSPPPAEEEVECTNVDFKYATLDVANLGGAEYCCVTCPNDSSQLCCPSRDASGQTTLEIGKHSYFEFNECVDEANIKSYFGTKSYFKLDGVNTNPNSAKTSIIVFNTSEYSSTWPQLVPGEVSGLGPLGIKPRGYLNNGRKSGTLDVDELIQLNLCANRMVKVKACFVDEDDDEVMMSQASLRFFDIDHGVPQEGEDEHMGPEVFQFQCPGGTFELYGLEVEDPDDGEFLVNMDTKTKTLEFSHDEAPSPNDLQVHRYDCPPAGEWVTLWSSRTGNGKDNPTDLTNLNKVQEQSMVVVNYVNTDCFQVILANLPSEYEKGSHNENANAIQLLMDSKEITSDWPGMSKGECEWHQSGRNWLFAGLKGEQEVECSPPPTPPMSPPPLPPPPSLPSPSPSPSVPPSSPSPSPLPLLPPSPSLPPLPPLRPPVITVHGDPMAKIGGKPGEHLWLASGVLTPLLEWTSSAGKRMVLSGRTIDRRASGSQWFKQLVVSADGTRSIDMSAETTDRGTVKILMDGKAIRDTPVLGATSLFASAHQNITMHMSKRSRKHMNIADNQAADEMEIDADGLKMTVWTSKARKFTSAAEQNMYLHLNFKMEHGVPKGSKGLLAELAGDVPMSEATRAMFKQGRRGGRTLQP